MDTTVLSKLYTELKGRLPETVTELPSSGSNRRYFRLASATATIRS